MMMMNSQATPPTSPPSLRSLPLLRPDALAFRQGSHPSIIIILIEFDEKTIKVNNNRRPKHVTLKTTNIWRERRGVLLLRPDALACRHGSHPTMMLSTRELN